METYKPSGKFRFSIFGLTAALAVVGVALGWVYQWLIDVVPWIYLSVVITLGFGLLLFLGAGWVTRLGRCRNVALAILVAVIAGLLVTAATYYHAYTIFLDDAMAAENIPAEQRAVATEQFPFRDYLKFRVETGWSIGRPGRDGSSGMPIKGVFVYLVWLIEAGILVGGAALGAVGAARQPYCESCDEWTEADLLTVALPQPEPDTVERVKTATSVDQLLSVPIAPSPDEASSLVYSLSGCPRCENSAFLTVKHVSVTVNKKDEAETETEDLWSDLVLSPAQLETMQAFSEQVEAAAGSAVETMQAFAEQVEAASGSTAAKDGEEQAEDVPPEAG
ncbi:MAG: hypothetical protein OER86_05955 [Phycisphaerae bacterium]|nr:hypothetical protein [Phycisphaerae bacterium]